MTQTIKDSLEAAGYIAEIHDLNWFQDDYGLKGDGPDDDDDDDDEDDENDLSYEMVDDDISNADDMEG